MRLLRVQASLCLLVLLCSLVTAPAAVADRTPAVSATGGNTITASDRTVPGRTVLAYQRQSRTLFRVGFRATHKHEKRLVTARIRVAVPKRASDPMLVATYYLYCAKHGTNYGSKKILGSQNIYAGTTSTFNPRYVYTALRPGRHECWLRLSGGRPRASRSHPGSNVLRIGHGSNLRLTEPVFPTSQQAFRPGRPSKRVQHGHAVDVVRTKVRVPMLTRYVQVSGIAWLTACTAKEGSLDPVTHKLLCAGRINRKGSTVRTRIVVTQPSLIARKNCTATSLPSRTGRTTRITADVHHKMVSLSGVARISGSIFCSRTLRLTMWVHHVKGAATVIHSQGTTATAILPRAWPL